MQNARRRASDYRLPTAYHLAVGAVFGLLLAAQGLPLPWRFVVEIALFVATAAMLRWSRRVTGRSVNGWRSGSTLWVSALLLLLFVGLGLATIDLQATDELRVGPMVAGVVMFVAAAAADWLWTLVYRAELRR